MAYHGCDEKGNDGKIKIMTIVHLFETCNQDSSAVLALLNDVFRRLKDIMPHLQSIYLRQDNAGYYHYALTLVTASNDQISYGRLFEFRPRYRVVISNAGGKRIIWGVPGVEAVLCRPPLSSIKKPVRWDVVNFVNNVQYGEEGVRVWRSGYKIHSLKQVPCS